MTEFNHLIHCQTRANQNINQQMLEKKKEFKYYSEKQKELSTIVEHFRKYIEQIIILKEKTLYLNYFHFKRVK